MNMKETMSKEFKLKSSKAHTHTHTFNMFYIFAEKFKQTHREQTQR